MIGKNAVVMFEQCKPDTGNYHLNASTENPSKINHLPLREKNVVAPKPVMKLITKQKNKSFHSITSLIKLNNQ